MDDNELINRFLEDVELRGWSTWTIRSCNYTLNLLKTSNGEISFTDVTNNELKGFLSFLKKRKGRNGEISYETLRKHINNLSSFYEFLEDEDLITKSPVPKFRRKYIRSSFKDTHKAEIRQIIDISQMRKLIGSILDPHDRAMFVLMAKTGLRAQELISIDISDVSLDDMTVSLKPTGKRKQMMVFFDFETKKVLARWVDLRKEIAVKDEDALFITERGRRISHSVMTKRLKNYAEWVGLHNPSSSDLDKRFTSHCFRHFFTTELINAGMSREYVKELRGDSRSETIDIYTHITANDLKREYLHHIPKFNI